MNRRVFRGALGVRHMVGTVVIGAILGSLLSAGEARAAIIVFKDGFSVRGKITRQKDFVVDPATGASFTIPLAGGFYYVDDGVRRIHFSPNQINPNGIIDEEPNKNKNLMVLKKQGTSVIGDSILPGWEFESMSDWNARWERTIRVYVHHNAGRLNIVQRLTYLTPETARVDTLRFNWIPYYFTKELGPEAARNLVLQFHKDKKGMKDEDKRLEAFKFLYQAGWLDHAAKELDDFLTDFPDMKSQAVGFKEKLDKLQASQFVDKLMLAHKAGQHRQAQDAVTHFDRANLGRLVEPEQLLEVQKIKNKYLALNEKLQQVKECLKGVANQGSPIKNQKSKIKNPIRALFTEAVEAIGQELNLDTLARLETFLAYAQQFDRELKQKKKTSQTAEEVLALAITGWLQGDVVALPDVKMAQLLWQARKLVLEYEKTSEAGARQELLAAFLKKHKLGVDVAARMIPLLPPPEPHETINTEMQKLSITGEVTAQGTPYYLKLPPEYHHGRPYPVLILLHAPQDKPQNMLARFSDLAARHGYILVAPQWGKGLRFSYNFTPAEHAVVTDCLRDLRRRFQVDSDRVFLSGWRQGGTMAFDVGLSHPDLFAGVLTLSGTPGAFPQRYFANGQYLPFYCVEGDMNGNNPKSHRMLFKDWIRWQYPSLYIEYKGRGSEWFSAELPFMFDWMNRKVRVNPLKQVGLARAGGGSGEEFRTLRECDNAFYWLTTSAISPRCLAPTSDLGKNTRTLAATVAATISTAADLVVKKGRADKDNSWNHINVRTNGLEQLTIWLGPKMIDYAKPVQVRVNGGIAGRGNRMIQPSLHTLLEDLYQRGDRQRLYFAKIDLNLNP